MRINNRMERHLRQQIDFSVFHLLSVVPQAHGSTVILLMPRNTAKDKYFNMKRGSESYWYCSLDQMLDACVEGGYISRVHAALLKRSYGKFTRRS